MVEITQTTSLFLSDMKPCRWAMCALELNLAPEHILLPTPTPTPSSFSSYFSTSTPHSFNLNYPRSLTEHPHSLPSFWSRLTTTFLTPSFSSSKAPAGIVNTVKPHSNIHRSYLINHEAHCHHPPPTTSSAGTSQLQRSPSRPLSFTSRL